MYSDLNFLTIHGKSRFPGLFVWLRDGRKASIKIPDGCLLVQAGQQLEYVTGTSLYISLYIYTMYYLIVEYIYQKWV